MSVSRRCASILFPLYLFWSFSCITVGALQPLRVLRSRSPGWKTQHQRNRFFLSNSKQNEDEIGPFTPKSTSPVDASRDNKPESTNDASDWLTAEFTLRNMPTEPSPSLSPEQIAVTCIRSLQYVDYPTESAGLKRCFPFFTWECRKVVTARQGGDSVERFCKYGVLSPALQPFMGAYRIDLGDGTLTQARPPNRGALMSFPIIIQGAPVLALQYLSGMDRAVVAEAPPETHMVMRLEQQRRPPMQGCWLVREVLDIRRAFAGDMGNAHVGG